ncbi:MAG TPA: hypothetical protein ENI69_07125 [Rhodospirillales bacterium]|nr:hypothetical protein [Rhodospirillales bacterium]
MASEDKVHKIVFHVDENDPKRMNLVLNNAANVDAYFKAKGEETLIEIVTYGPGLNMLIAGKHPKVQKRISSFEQNFDNISFKACGNTMKKFAKKTGKPVILISQAEIVPSGVVQLILRQEQGWSYIRP